MAGIALKGQADLISIMVPLEVSSILEVNPFNKVPLEVNPFNPRKFVIALDHGVFACRLFWVQF